MDIRDAIPYAQVLIHRIDQHPTTEPSQALKKVLDSESDVMLQRFKQALETIQHQISQVYASRWEGK